MLRFEVQELTPQINFILKI